MPGAGIIIAANNTLASFSDPIFLVIATPATLEPRHPFRGGGLLLRGKSTLPKNLNLCSPLISAPMSEIPSTYSGAPGLTLLPPSL